MTLEEAIKTLLDAEFDILVTCIPKRGRKAAVMFGGENYTDMIKFAERMISAKEALVAYDKKREEWLK